MSTPAVLTRADSLPNNIDPNGRRWAYFSADNNLLIIRPVRVDSEGQEFPDEVTKIPTDVEGYFTSITRANAAIKNYLSRMWDYSDEQTAKALPLRARVLANKARAEQASGDLLSATE
jgi:hypothetical protein